MGANPFGCNSTSTSKSIREKKSKIANKIWQYLTTSILSIEESSCIYLNISWIYVYKYFYEIFSVHKYHKKNNFPYQHSIDYMFLYDRNNIIRSNVNYISFNILITSNFHADPSSLYPDQLDKIYRIKRVYGFYSWLKLQPCFLIGGDNIIRKRG